MNRKAHYICYYIVAVPLAVYLKNLDLLWVFFISNPDIDLYWKHHRNLLTHSVMLPLILFFMIGSPAVFLPTAIHLLCDTKPKGERVGTYRLWFINHRIGGIQSELFVFINALMSLSIFLWLI